ncbi:MAG: rod shape-determining protein MreD [Endomicrobiaceae bacterium]|nr:rod shape-determining protein MreD [Endomicrobiaceae bacterium]
MINYIVMFLLYIIILTLQFVLPKYLVCNEIYPNFILIYVVYVALNKGAMKGQLTGFLYGLSWDILSTDIFGVRTLTLTLAGYIAGKFNRNLNKEQIVIQVIIMFICLIITHLSLVLLYLLIPDNFAKKSIELNSNFLLYCLVNIVITPIIFKALPALNKIFKQC